MSALNLDLNYCSSPHTSLKFLKMQPTNGVLFFFFYHPTSKMWRIQISLLKCLPIAKQVCSFNSNTFSRSTPFCLFFKSHIHSLPPESNSYNPSSKIVIISNNQSLTSFNSEDWLCDVLSNYCSTYNVHFKIMSCCSACYLSILVNNSTKTLQLSSIVLPV